MLRTPSQVRLDRVRLVQIIPRVGTTGGLERVATTLTIGLASRLDRIVVCTSGGQGYEGALADAGVSVVLIPRPIIPPIRIFLRSIPPIARVLRRERPHVVHAHNPGAALAAAIALRLAGMRGVPVVSTYHGVADERTGLAARLLAATSDIVVGIGPTATAQLRAGGFPQQRSATVLNGVSAEHRRSRADVRREFGATGSELIVTVGRYVEAKNQALLLEALALLAPRRPSLRALLVGTGELERDLQTRIEQLGLENVATLTGPRADALDITAAADVFAMSSRWEGLGLAAIEAMLLGCPVVSTAAGGIEDVVRDGETGVVVPSDDAPALAAAIERLLDDRALSRRLAARAADFAGERFSAAVMIERYSLIYADSIQRRAAREGRLHTAGEEDLTA